MSNWQIQAVIIGLFLVSSVCCASFAEGGVSEIEVPTFSHKRLMGPVFPNRTVRHLLHEMAKIRDGHFEEAADQEIIFDGVVERISPPNEDNIRLYLVKPTHVYAGKSLIDSQLVKILCASSGQGSVALGKGYFYRFRAIDWTSLQGDKPIGYFSAWNGSVLKLKKRVGRP